MFSPCKAATSSMALHSSNTSLASADPALSGSETEDLVTPQVPYLRVHWHSDLTASPNRMLSWGPPK